MALVTNGIAVVQRRRIKKAGLDRYFRLIVISEEIGYPKPDPLFFDITLKKLDNPDKDEVLIIGDSLTSDIAGGNLSGIDTCWFNPESKDNEGEFQSTYSIKKLLDLLTLL
jgi:HAD superfamily hydrolase (TIGR01549 family)